MSSTEIIIEFTRYYLAVFFSGVALFYFVRIVSKQKSSGVKLIHSGPKMSSNWVNHLFFKLFRAAIWMVCVLRAIFPSFDNGLGLIVSLQSPYLISFGLLLLTGGFVFTVVAHVSMGRHWRSGIDAQIKTQLLTTGLFSLSRNPMYLGVVSAQIGFFFALPSIFTLVCLLAGVSFIYRQTLLEESHLLNQHTDDYQRYKLKVRRWV